MSYATAASFRQALEQRLKNEAADTSMTIARLRKRVAFEAFLHRLLLVAPERWVLKGALALDFRLPTKTRSTKDIDLGRGDDEEAAVSDIAAAQRLRLEDFFTFAAARTSALDDAADFTAVRFHVIAQLGGRTFEQFRVDVGFMDSISYEPDIVRSAGLLSFAGIPRLELPTIPIPHHLAEKVHAYTRTYGDRQRRSTRPKDLVDILLIASSEALDASALRESLQSTFEGRARQPLPARLPPPPPIWAPLYAKLAGSVGVETNLHAAYMCAASFLDPVLAGAAGGQWDTTTRKWGHATDADAQPDSTS